MNKSDIMSKLPIVENEVITTDERHFTEELKKIVQVNLKRVYSAINYGQVYTNWCIGKRIFEQEQKGQSRAEYGKRIIAIASNSLTEEYGSGYSITNIKSFRKFYVEYQDYIIGQTCLPNLKEPIQLLLLQLRLKKGIHRLTNLLIHWNYSLGLIMNG